MLFLTLIFTIKIITQKSVQIWNDFFIYDLDFDFIGYTMELVMILQIIVCVEEVRLQRQQLPSVDVAIKR